MSTNWKQEALLARDQEIGATHARVWEIYKAVLNQIGVPTDNAELNWAADIHATVTIDDERFYVTPVYPILSLNTKPNNIVGGNVSLLRRCAQCNQDVESGWIHSKAELGQFLADFHPQTCYLCSSEVDEPETQTDLQALQTDLETLRDTISALLEKMQPIEDQEAA